MFEENDFWCPLFTHVNTFLKSKVRLTFLPILYMCLNARVSEADTISCSTKYSKQMFCKTM